MRRVLRFNFSPAHVIMPRPNFNRGDITIRRNTLNLNRITWADGLAWGFILLFIITFTGLALLRHYSFNSSGFDLGIYDQVTWNTLHGRPFFYTTTGQPLLHFSNHVSVNLLLVAPFYLIYSGPEMLLFLQAAAIGLGGLPLFWLSREKLNSDIAGLVLLLAYLLFPTLEITTLWDFHPPILSVGFFMFAFYFLEKQRFGWFMLMTLLAMSGKEQLALQAAFLGLYAIVRFRAWRAGLLTIGLAVAWFLTIMYWIIPANSVTGDHLFIGYYADLGNSPLEIVVTALTRPDLIIKNLWQPAKLKYLFDLLTPFAGLPLIGLPVLVIGAPSFAINLLSANTAMHNAAIAQYGADVAPWLAWATLFGAVNLRQGLLRLWPNRSARLTAVISLILLAAALTWHLFRGFSPLALNPPTWEITPHDRLAQRFIAQIPPDASISAQGKLYPHLSNRRIAYQLPDVNEAEYVFFDATTGAWPVHPNDIWALAQNLLHSRQYGVLDAADGYLLLRRGLPNTKIPNAFYSFARVPSAEPAYSAQINFGGKLRLLGFDLSDDPRSGETAVKLYWQVLQSVNKKTRLYPFFVDAQGRVVETTDQRPMLAQLWYPAELWQPGEILVTETMPWTLGDQWSLAVGVMSDNNWADWSQRLPAQIIAAPPAARRFEANTWVRLNTFERQGRNLVEITPPDTDLQPPHPVQANLGDQMELTGYGAAQTGGELTVTLYWHALASMPLDYTVFVHVLTADGQLVAQHDDAPWWEAPLPTSTWQAGEHLQDRHRLTLPANLPPGTYHLQAGVYYWETLERLPVLENGQPVNNFVELGQITVQ